MNINPSSCLKKERNENLDIHIRRWRQEFNFVFHTAAINNKSRSQRSLTITKPPAQDVKDNDLSSSDDWPWRKCHRRKGVHGSVLNQLFLEILRKTTFSRPKTNNTRIPHTSWGNSRVTCIQVFTNHFSFFGNFHASRKNFRPYHASHINPLPPSYNSPPSLLHVGWLNSPYFWYLSIEIDRKWPKSIKINHYQTKSTIIIFVDWLVFYRLPQLSTFYVLIIPTQCANF